MRIDVFRVIFQSGLLIPLFNPFGLLIDRVFHQPRSQVRLPIYAEGMKIYLPDINSFLAAVVTASIDA